jgi:selenide,water dikinase
VTTATQLVLAGGGHSHALLLRRWAMRPKQRPAGLITLVNRSSTTLYSGMVPGLIAGLYNRDQVAIDLRRLAADAGVAFIETERASTPQIKPCH